MVSEIGHHGTSFPVKFGKGRVAFPLCLLIDIFSGPVIGACHGIYVVGGRLVIAGGNAQVEILDQQILLDVVQRGGQPFRLSMFAAEHDGHHIGVLYFRILVAVSESQQQTVRPRLVHDTNLGDDRLIVVAVMETPVPFLFGISTVAVIGLYLVVIVRIILVGIQLHGKSVFCRIAETYIGFMGVE